MREQVANIVPLTLMRLLRKGALPLFGTLLLLGAVSCSAALATLLPCVNHLSSNPYACDGVIVAQVYGQRYSLGLWGAAFCAGVVGSSGNLILVPFMCRFRSVYTSAYLAGTGASGVLASALAAFQVWEASMADPNFGVDVFCSVVSGMCTLSLVAWLAIIKLDYDYEVLRSSGKVGRGGESDGNSSGFSLGVTPVGRVV